jgi:hypothetical protein
MNTLQSQIKLSLNTHAYDGLLKNSPEFNIICNISDIVDDRNMLFSWMRKLLTEKNIHAMCIARYDIIVSNAQQPPNFDPTNQLFADNLLFKICYIAKTNDDIVEDIIKMLALQLEDMGTGFCPQGRTTRLYQILCCIHDIKTVK